MADFPEKLGDLMIGGLGSLAGALLPDHWKHQAKARLADFNPFDIIKGNHDLTRAVRIAWIEAALKVLEAARASRRGLAGNTEPNAVLGRGPQADPLRDFIDTAEHDLRAIRHAAWDRRGHVGATPIDQHVEAVLLDTPASIAPGADPALAQTLTQNFTETLATITGWPLAEIPTLPGRIAQDGLPTIDGGARRSFGELVFAAFAELLKDPKKYPEAGAAFSIAMQDAARKLAQEALARINGLDSRLDTIIQRHDADRVIEAGATEYLSILPRLLEGQTQLQQTVGTLAAAQAAEAALAAARHDAAQAAEERRHREWMAQQARMLELLAQERGVPLPALQAQLARLGEVDVPHEQITAKLDAFVAEFLKLKEDLARPTNADPEVAATRVRALELLNAGNLDGARALFVSVLSAVRERRQQAAHEEATLLADRARIDMLQVRYPDAIAAYEEAADVVRFDAEVTHGHLLSLSGALTTQGTEFGDNAALRRAIDILRARALPFVSRELAPLDWAMTQHNLGNALSTLGERESGTARLEEAVAAYHAALEERTRERVPLDWAATQNNLGIALRALGVRESGTARLEAAVTAYRAALEECTRERAPLAWAATQNNLGAALSTLGVRESGTARLEEAVAAYRAALEEWTRERVPLDWAMTQHNLGLALCGLGEREGGTGRLEEAVMACRAALEERTRERVPLDWAMTQNNLGNALRALGERESGTARLEEAVAAYRAALEEWTRERVPLDWAMTQHNLGLALCGLGEREGGTGRLEEAVMACRAALEERTRERVPLDWAMTQNNLGNALRALGERESGTGRLEEAVMACRAALEERTRERVPLDWAMTQNNLGNALRALGERESGTGRLEEAVTAYRAALEVRTRERVPLQWAATQEGLDRTLAVLVERRR